MILSNCQSKMISKVLLLALALGFISACGGKSDDDLIAETQECLNRASSTTALSCVTVLEGKTSEAANLLRCAAYYKDQEFSDPQRLASIGEQMKGGGDSAVMTMMSALAYASDKYSAPQNLTLVNTAAAYCFNSGSKGLVVLASMSKIATATLSVAGILDPNNPPTATQVQAALCATDQNGSTAPVTVIGETAIAAFNQGCIGTNGASSNPFCSAVTSSAGASLDPATVGRALTDQLCTN